MSDPIVIADPSDPRIAEYRNLRERDLVRRDGLFIAEGRVVLDCLIASTLYRPRSVLIASNKLSSAAALLHNLPGSTAVYTAAKPLFNAIAGFDVHRGILAVGERCSWPNVDELLAPSSSARTVLVLNKIANHDNMGGLFRNAAAFGIDAVLLDPQCCDPLYRKAIRVSAGAVFRIPFARLQEDAVTILERHGYDILALSPSGEVPLHQVRPEPRTALLLGAEGPGLDRHLLQRAKRIRIDMTAGFDSLNVATAAAIALYQLSRSRS